MYYLNELCSEAVGPVFSWQWLDHLIYC